MASVVEKLVKAGLIKPPSFVASNTVYETIMGSEAYGISTDSSDKDIYGFCIPSKEIVFPHTVGVIPGFGNQGQVFEQFQEHHIYKQDEEKEYDLTIFSIVKFFKLAMECNPNVIDSLYTPAECMTHCSQVGVMVRESRDLFLSKAAWKKFKGYAFGEMTDMLKEKTGKRKELVDKYGYDTKNASHVLRLLDEIEQILVFGTIDIRRNKEQLKFVRAGLMSLSEFKSCFASKENVLDTLYSNSKLREKPDEAALKQLLFNCLEHHYGSLSGCIVNPDKEKLMAQEVVEVMRKYGYC